MVRNIKAALVALAGVGGLGLMTVPAFAGSLNWSGTVDDTATIAIRGRDIRVDSNFKGVRDERRNMDGVLPRRDLRVDLRNTRGRGDVQIIQQPNERNHFTAIVRIKDYQAGADRYRFRLVWRDRNEEGHWRDGDGPRGRDNDDRNDRF